MKQFILASLLALGTVGAAHAQADTAESQSKAERAQRDAEDAKIRAQLDKARQELDRKAQEVAELSMKLSGANDVVFHAGGPRQAMLGVQVDPDSGKQGARVLGVSPGGPADEAGMRSGDIVVTLDGKPIAGTGSPGRALVDEMRGVKPDQKVKVRVLRDGKPRDLVVVARPLRPSTNRMYDFRGPGVAMRGSPMGAMPFVQHFRTIIHNEFDGLELASITPKLGAYFGANDGVLVVSAPDNDAFKLEDGDVIQAIDGRKPTDGAHALRILRSYKSGEKLNLAVLRQRKPLTLAVTMPERGDPEEDLFMTAPMPELPPPPGA
jgi:S1-C subfamily serine protease